MTGSFAAMVHCAPGSLLERWQLNHVLHPDIFDCAVRVLSGQVEHEGKRWRTRRSAVDSPLAGATITLNHGPKAALRLVIEPDPFADGLVRRRVTGAVIFCAIEQASNAVVQVSVPVIELVRFGFVAR